MSSVDQRNPDHKYLPRDVEFHQTLSTEDRERLDMLAHRMGVSRTEMIRRALHLVQAVQERQGLATHEQE